VTPELSPNAQAILLLTAPLIAGRGNATTDLLSPGEYKRIARRIRDMQRQPQDLLSQDSAALVRDCQPVVDETRLQRLLARGFLLSQVVERWQARAIWVQSRADAGYPRRLKVRLGEDAPAVLYGCGDISLLNTGGLAVVGSRNVDEILIDYTRDVGRLVAAAGRAIISGGARGIDHAAMFSALEAGGKAIGVLADSLEKRALNRENREALMGGQLLLISPYDPSAGFNVGNAMRRNKLIYALADASLVINSDFNTGGTWAGATEQLDKFRMVPVYVRSTGESSAGIDALRKKGAVPWPNPADVNTLKQMLAADSVHAAQPRLPGSANGAAPVSTPDLTRSVAPDPRAVDRQSAVPRSVPGTAIEALPPVAVVREVPHSAEVADKLRKPVADRAARKSRKAPAPADTASAEDRFSAVRDQLRDLLIAPMKPIEVASALNVSTTQARIWLRRLVDEGILEAKKKPVLYTVKRSDLFG
jgi:DNA processing protein